jgi:hypothetical protein
MKKEKGGNQKRRHYDVIVKFNLFLDFSLLSTPSFLHGHQFVVMGERTYDDDDDDDN